MPLSTLIARSIRSKCKKYKRIIESRVKKDNPAFFAIFPIHYPGKINPEYYNQDENAKGLVC